MSFLHPEYVYFILPFLLVFFVYLFIKKEAQTEFFSEEVMNKLRVGGNTLPLKVRNILFFIISILLVVALAEPVIKNGQVEVKSKSADIVIALDISDSMLAEDVYPNRLKMSKQKAMELLKIAPNERIGIVAFAKNSYLVSPMSFDHDAVGFLLRQLSTDSITEKGTNFLSLLNVVQNTIQTTNKKHLLIISDGGDSDDFEEEIAYAKENNIIVFVLGVASKKGAPIKKEDGSFITHKGEIIVSSLNENIAKLATQTGGVYMKSIKSNDDVQRMLKEIESIGEKKELKSEIIEKFIPLFYYPVGLALVLLLIATSSLKRVTPSLFVLAIFSFASVESKAALLDFMDLSEAKVAYEDSNYSKAQDLYEKYANENNNSQSYYNQANALYKQDKFDEALLSYKKTNFDDNISKANTLANMGNTYVKQAKEKALENAIEVYKSSLELHEDKEVRENLEAVEKELQKQKEKEDKKDKKDKDKNEDNKDEKKDNKEDSKDKKEGDSENKSKDKDSKDKEKSKEQKENKKDKEEKSDKEKDSDKQKEKKKDLEKLDNDEQGSNPKEAQTQGMKKEEMSDAEQKKWLDKLNAKQNTYMYMLNNSQNNEENSNEKPW